MDSSTIDQADLDRLTDKDKQDLRQFIQNEQQRTRIQARMRPLFLFRTSPRKLMPRANWFLHGQSLTI